MEEAGFSGKQPGKSGKSTSKSKRKNGRTAEQILKTLNGIPDAMKLGTLALRYAELEELHNASKGTVAGLEKQNVTLQKEKDQLQADHGKQLLARNHLEGLCRELYRLNKIVKEDSVNRIREEEERRKEVTSKFESTLNEVTNMMQENTVKNDKLRDDNISMTVKMKALYSEFESRKEEQIRLDKQIDLERQLSQVQIEKAQLEIQTERAIWDDERCSLLDRWKQSETCCEELQAIIEDLRRRMETYEGRHVGYRNAIDSNSKFFEKCKAEIDSMNHKVGLMEGEIAVWKERSQHNAIKAMDLSAAKQTQEAQLATARRQVESLQSLCRQLQEDRSTYLKILKAKGIDPDLKTFLAKENLAASQKELLLKPIGNQLNSIKEDCVAKKDQMAVDALENFMEVSKSQNSVNSGINLTLGFINYKAAAKKASQSGQPTCKLPDYAKELVGDSSLP